MALCKTTPCASDFTAPDTPQHLKSGPFQAGEIVSTDAIVFQPIHAAIASGKAGGHSAISKSIVSDMNRSSRTHQTGASQGQISLSVQNPEVGVQKIRPAIFMPKVEADNGPRVCLMATFSGRDVSKFPTLVKNFLIPVFPTAPLFGVPLVGRDHMHTLPPWAGNGDPQWIIGRSIVLENRELGNRWRDQGGEGTTHYEIGRDAMLRLRVILRSRNAAWNNKSPELKEAYINEFKVRLDFSLPNILQLAI